MLYVSRIRLSLILSLMLSLAACGGGGGSSPEIAEDVSLETTPSAVSAFLSKAPVDGATCNLHDTNDQVVAGPVISNAGVIQFTAVSYTGDVYTQCSSGSYVDEATGSTVQLAAQHIMRSVTNTIGGGSSTVNQIVTPLTEIAHRLARTSGDLSSANMAIKAAEVADNFGLDNIDITQVQPTPLNAITGNTSDSDLYGIALSAVSQMQEDAKVVQTPPTGDELLSLITQVETDLNATGFDSAAYTQSLINLTSNSNTQSVITDITPISSLAPNVAPVLNAGADQTVTSSATVTLIGSSSDTDGTISSYSWSEVDGSSLTLGTTTSPTLSFTAPSVTVNSTYTLRLTVTDNDGATATDDVVVAVLAAHIQNNVPPIANAGADQTVASSATVTLNGSGSDTDGIISSYSWSQVGESNLNFSTITNATLGFTAPTVSVDTTYTLRLTVTDNVGATGFDDVEVTVLAAPPTPIEINKSAKWQVAVPISDESDNIGILKEAIKSDIGSGESGQTNAIWNEYSGGRWHIMQNTYSPSIGWDSPFHIDAESDNAKIPLLSVNRLGNAIAIWREGVNTWAKRFNVDSGWGSAESVGDATPGVGALSINELGEIFWVYPQWDGDSDAIFVKKYSPESGWESSERIDDDTQGHAFSPAIVVDPSGNSVVVWAQYDGAMGDATSHSNIWVNIYNKTNGWAGAQSIESQNDGHASDAQVAIDNNGNAIVSWTQLDGPSYLPATTRSSIFVNSFHASNGWNGATKISGDNDLNAITSSISLNGSGNGIIVWNEYPWNGVTPAIIKAKTVTNISLALNFHEVSTGGLWDNYSAYMKKATTPRVAVDPTGKAIAVWRGVGSIFAATYYPDDGWQSPELIGTGGFVLYQPKISIDSYGRANATWVQQINDFVNPTSYRVWANRMD